MRRLIWVVTMAATAGCSAVVDYASRTDWTCSKAESHLRECCPGYGYFECTPAKDGTRGTELSRDQSECVLQLDCAAIRAQTASGSVCGVSAAAHLRAGSCDAR